MSRPTRRGHTLVELLVVILIIGVIIAIAVPAIQKTRETARRANCMTNQKQLAAAILAHNMATNGNYPGYKAIGPDGATPVGWAVQIFPFIGKNELYRKLAIDPNAGTFVSLLVCPSDFGSTGDPRMSYVVNGGKAGENNADLGIFHDHSIDIANRVYVANDQIPDGQANTFMLAENLDAVLWTDTGNDFNQCFLYQAAGPPLVAGKEINKGVGDGALDATFARPSSHHPGGFVVAYADGRVKFINQEPLNNDPAIYKAMITPAGGEPPPVVPLSPLRPEAVDPVVPIGGVFALIDIGPGGQRLETVKGSGQAFDDNRTAGTASNSAIITLTSDLGNNFSIAISNLNTSGVAIGNIDWRDRGDSINSAQSLVILGEDFVKNNSGIVRVTLWALSAGTYNVTSYHLDSQQSQSDNIKVWVDNGDGNGFVDTGAVGNAGANLTNLVDNYTTVLMEASQASFSFTADGTNPVEIVFDGTPSGDNETPLNGLYIVFAP